MKEVSVFQSMLENKTTFKERKMRISKSAFGLAILLTLWIAGGNSLATAADIEPPEFVAATDKPVRFNYETRILTLYFNESIDADPETDVDLTKLAIKNHKFGSVVVDEFDNLGGASVTQGSATMVTITLTSAQSDILKGNKPMLTVEDGAVKDIAGNLIAVGGTTEFPVYVTPPLLSGVETVYDGDLVPATLELKFTEVIEVGAIDWNKITVTNENGAYPFVLSASEFYGLISDAEGLKTKIRFVLSMSHRDRISYWQRNYDITQLHIKLDDGAVFDVNGNPNAAMADSERINWDTDNAGPTVLSSSTYSHDTVELVLRFDETLNLSSADHVRDIVDSGRVHLRGKKADDSTIGVVTLSDYEIASPKADSVELKYTLSNRTRDAIANLQGAGAVKLYIDIESGAVRDLAENTGFTSVDMEEANWDKDVLAPGFVYCVYSPGLRRLRIRFNELISDSTGLKPDLSKLRVHIPGGPGESLVDAKYYLEGDALIVYDLNDAQHNAIANKINPLVSLEAGAVKDLAGNSSYALNNGEILYDTVGPSLSATENSYTINLHEDAYPESGALILNFNEKVDVSEIDLEKIKLEADGSSISLKGEEKKTTSDSTEVKFEITGVDKTDKNDKVYTISGWGREYDTLYVELEVGAIKDMAGNENALQTQALNTWVKDTAKPEFGSASYYHDIKEDDHHYARLVLKFREQMDTRPAYITAENISLARDQFGGPTITLTSNEIFAQDFSDTIKFNLTKAHRNTITRWGAPSGYGDGKSSFWVFLADNAVQDRAGNLIAAFTMRLAIADWRKDTDPGDQDAPANAVSASYNANNKKLAVTFDELMDVKPANHVDATKFKIWNHNKDVSVTLDGYPPENNETDTIEVMLSYDSHAAVNNLTPPLYLGITNSNAARKISAEGCKTLDKDQAKIVTFIPDTISPRLVCDPDNPNKSNYDNGVLTLTFDENLKKPVTLADVEADAFASKFTLMPAPDEPGFSLTAHDIHIMQPGNVLGDTGDGHEFKFFLTDAHKNTVYGWINLYVTIAPGAVKDTKDNFISGIAPYMVKELPTFGDVSGDGTVSAYDAALVLQHIRGLITLSADQQDRGDVDGEPGLTVNDADLILKKVVGLIE